MTFRKNKISVFLIFYLVFTYYNGFAQKNEIAFGLQGVKYFGRYNEVVSFVEFTNLTYRRKIREKVFAFANINFRRDLYYADVRTNKLSPNTAAYFGPIGSRLWRDDYDYFDLGLHYKLYDKGKHKFNFGTGFSYGRGKNIYLDAVKYIIFRGEKVPIKLDLSTVIGHYFGAVLNTTYCYNFSENWAVGGILSYRLYNRDFPSLINYGIFLNCVL